MTPLSKFLATPFHHRRPLISYNLQVAVDMLGRHVQASLCGRNIPLSCRVFALVSSSKYRDSPRSYCASKSEELSFKGNEEAGEAVGYGYNSVEKKKGLYRPKHTLEEQIAYMRSKGKWCLRLCPPIYLIPCVYTPIGGLHL